MQTRRQLLTKYFGKHSHLPGCKTKLWLGLRTSLAVTVLSAASVSSEASGVAHTFTLDGNLFSDSAGATPLIDGAVSLRIRILNEAQNCILYEEQQTVSTIPTKGHFSIQVGSPVGSSKRTSNDSSHPMSTVYQNESDISGLAVADLSACTQTASGNSQRYLRVTVSAPSIAGGERTLAPDLAINAVPHAVVAGRAETLRGIEPNQFLQVNTSGSNQLTQANLESVFSSSTNVNQLSSLIAGTNTNYVRNVANTGAAIPSFAGDPSTPAVGSIWYDSVGQTVRLQTGTGAVSLASGSVATELPAPAGSAAAPSYAFTGDINTGLFSPTADSVGLSTAGTERVRIDSSGRMGIGTQTPTSRLEVVSAGDPISGLGVPANYQLQVRNSMGGAGQGAGIAFENSTSPGVFASVIGVRDGSGVGDLRFFTADFANTPVERLRIERDGNVGIGTTAPAARLDVAGSIRASNSFGNIEVTSNIGCQHAKLQGDGGSGSPGLEFAPGNCSPYDTRIYRSGSNSLRTPGNLFVDGSLGVGTATPSTLLDIGGGVTFRGLATASAPSAVASQGKIYFDSTDGKFRVSENGGAYVDLVSSGGSGNVSSGGNSFAQSLVIGTNDNHSLQFETNGTTKMTVGTDGSMSLSTPNAKITGNTGLTLEQTGDEFGAVRLNLQNRTGVNGAMFEQAGSVDLVDFVFKTLSHQQNVRLESRPGSAIYGAPEFQIGPASSTFTRFVVSGTAVGVPNGGAFMVGPFVPDTQFNVTSTGALVTPMRVAGNAAQISDLLQVIGPSGGTAMEVTAGHLVGINITNSSPSARLDVVDTGTTTSAIIVPRAGNFTGTAVDGMVRYNSTSNLFEFRQNGLWVNYTTVSDARLKTDVIDVDRALAALNQLRPVYYNWDPSQPRTRSFSKRREIGFLAQDVEQVLPEVVQKGADGYLSLEYGKMVSLVVAAIQELSRDLSRLKTLVLSSDTQTQTMVNLLKVENENLRARVERLEKALEQLEQNSRVERQPARSQPQQ